MKSVYFPKVYFLRLVVISVLACSTLPIANGTARADTASHAPDGISITSSSIAENQPIGSMVGSLSANDEEAGDMFVFSLTCAIPGLDDSSFNISDTSLRTSDVFDYETRNRYAVCIRVTDQVGWFFDKDFTITITDENDAPAINSEDGCSGTVTCPVTMDADQPVPPDSTLNALSSSITNTTRISVNSTGEQGNRASGTPSISADGRYVAFTSFATNLVSGDTNGDYDIFLRDTQTGTTKRVSVDSSGKQGNGDSYDPSISADGRYVAFYSDASNLVSGDTNGNSDIFLRDTQSGITTRISVDSSGVQGNDKSQSPSISGDGRFVAFKSSASNLVSGDTNNASDVFQHDMQTGSTTRISMSSNGEQGNNYSWELSISADGRYVAFSSDASNLVSGDTNNASDVFQHDMQTGSTTRISMSSNGEQGNSNSWEGLSISADGHYVAFYSDATNLVSRDTNGNSDIFLRDTQSGITTRISVDSSGVQGNGNSEAPSISADGRYVAFSSNASNLVNGDTNLYEDIFLHDIQMGNTTRISINSSGKQGNAWSIQSSISANGRFVAFASYASNLVSGDTNGEFDVFVVPATIFTLTVNKTGGGSGIITSNPVGINCGSSCSRTFMDGTSVTLTATASTGFVFGGWSGGGCSGTGTCTLVIKADTAVTANFTQAPKVPILISPVNNRLLTNYLPRLDWEDAASAQFYQVQVSTSSAFGTLFVDQEDLLVSDYTLVSPLGPNTTHYWRVRAFNSLGQVSAWSAVWSFRTALLPPTLIEFSALYADGENLLTNHPEFHWNDVPDAAGYTLQISRNIGFTALIGTYSRTKSTYTPSADLPRNTRLYWRVRSTGTNGPSAWSDIWTFFTANPPGAVALVVPANNILVSKSVPLLLDWSNATIPAGTAFDYYRLQIWIVSAGNPVVKVDQKVTDLTNSRYLLPADTLDPNTTYYWGVRSYNTLKQYSNWSPVRIIRTALLTPALTTPVNGEYLLYNRPTFDWSDVSGAAGYTLQISKNISFSALVGTYNVSASTYTPSSNLPRNSSLYWRVRTTGVRGPSAWTDKWTITTADPPSVPILVAPINNFLSTNYAPRLDWSNSTVPLGAPVFFYYRLQVADNANFSNPEIDQEIDGITKSEYTPSGPLAPETKYYWRVSSYNVLGQYSAWSLVRSFRTPIASVFGCGTDLDLIVGKGQIKTTDDVRAALAASAASGQPTITVAITGASNFSFGQEVLVIQMQGTGAGNYEFANVKSLVGNTITLRKNLHNTYTVGGNSKAQIVRVPNYHNVTVQAGGVLTVHEWDGNTGGIVAFRASGTVTVNGTIDATGQGFHGGSDGHVQDGGAYQGEGTPGIGTRSTSPNGNGGGGGGNQGAGGGGGNGTAGFSAIGGTPGGGGESVGSAELTNIFYGGGGGGWFANTSSSGLGGNGGGIIFISVSTLTVNGAITGNGNGTASGSWGSGGGGAGGSIYLISRTANLGTSLITALGGVAGDSSYPRNGGNGGVGRIRIDWGAFLSGSTNPAANVVHNPNLH